MLELVRSADGPVSVAEIADATGLHRNTARFHLDSLTESGLCHRETEHRDRPGRPRTVYSAPDDGQSGSRRSYQLLAEMLTGMVSRTDAEPAEAATQAGASWGRYLVQRPAPSQRVDVDDAWRRLHALLADAGFAPETESGPETSHPLLGLRQCPFREVAEHHRDVVCSLHLGLMRGALAEVGGPLAVEALQPFVEPTRCVAHFTSAAPGFTGSLSDSGDSPGSRQKR